MKQIVDYLLKFPNFQNIINKDVDLSANQDESLSFILACKYFQQPHTMLIVKENLLEAQSLYQHLSAILKDNCFLYCVDEITKFTSLATSPEMQASRLYILTKLLEKEKIVIVTHTTALKRFVPSKDVFQNSILTLKTNMSYEPKVLLQQLVRLGYKNVLRVTQSFEFSYRGGVIDVFSILYSQPIRIEFFDTEIESIRFFNLETQRTIQPISSCKIVPATEFLIQDLDIGLQKINELLQEQKNKTNNSYLLEDTIQEDMRRIKNYDFDESLFKYYGLFQQYGSLLDYFSNYKVYLFDKELILKNAEFVEKETYDKFLELFEAGQSLINLPIFHDIQTLLVQMKNINYFSTSLTTNQINVSFQTIDSFNFNYDVLKLALQEMLDDHYTIYIGLENKIHFESLCMYLDSQEMPYQIVADTENLKAGINLAHTDYQLSLRLLEYKFAILGEKSIFKQKMQIKNHFSKFKNAVTIQSVNELTPGDYLVHEQHGIGLYKGIETIQTNGIHRDYLHIEYKNGDILYVALEQFKLVRRYVSKEGVKPTGSCGNSSPLFS